MVAIDSGDVLEIAFPALIADWAVEGMIRQKELHDAPSRDACLLRLGDDLQAWAHA